MMRNAWKAWRAQKLILISAALLVICVGVYLLWEFYPLMLRDYRNSNGLGFLHVQCNRVSSIPKASVKLLMSFFSTEDSAPVPDYWLLLAKHTLQNHRTFANRTGVPYTRATRGHARCGKLRRVLEQLVSLPESAWLFFLDADVGMTCNLPIMTLSEYVSRWHAAVFRYDSLDVDMLVMTKFGVFAVRNSAWSRDYLRRLANAVESRRWLCRLTLPENWAFHAVTTQRDYCHIHEIAEVAKVDPQLVMKDRFNVTSFIHLTGSERKRHPHQFLFTLQNESRCLSGELHRLNNFSVKKGQLKWIHWELKEVYDPGNLTPRIYMASTKQMGANPDGLFVDFFSGLVAFLLLGLFRHHCRARHLNPKQIL